MTDARRWDLGAAEIEQLLRERQLERVEPSPSHAEVLIAQAEAHLESAALLVETDPPSAFALLYDGARKSLTAMLAIQGLRPTRSGGHVVVQHATEAQLSPRTRHLVRPFRELRRRRNESEYPQPDQPAVTVDEARAGLEDAAAILDTARRMLPLLGPFSP